VSDTEQHWKDVDSIAPAAMAAFYRAMADEKIDVSQYRLSFAESPDFFLISARHKLSPSSMRGSDPKYPTYEVRVSRVDFSPGRVELAY
jgi:hypothetical protein